MDETEVKERAQQLSRKTVEVISNDELAHKLAENRPLRIKLGMDPTAPDLHLGHTITLKKLRDFQHFGHTVIFLVGDFTATIGDPTGRSELRKPLTRDEVEHNAETYKRQVFKILDPHQTELRFNSEWMDHVSIRELIQIAANLSVARMLERDDFERRLAEQQPLFMHELLYPVIQGYDEAHYAIRFKYNERDFRPALEAFHAARANTGQILDQMADDDWTRAGTHTESGRYSVEDWLRIYAAHAHNHAAQIRRLRDALNS